MKFCSRRLGELIFSYGEEETLMGQQKHDSFTYHHSEQRKVKGSRNNSDVDAAGLLRGTLCTVSCYFLTSGALFCL